MADLTAARNRAQAAIEAAAQAREAAALAAEAHSRVLAQRSAVGGRREAGERVGRVGDEELERAVADTESAAKKAADAARAAEQRERVALTEFAALADPRREAVQLSPEFPLLLGPVRVETRFADDELLVRVFPDDWSIDAFEGRFTKHEVAATKRYWSQVWRAAGDRGGRLAAWRGLVATAGAGRAGWLVANHRPLNPADEPRRTRPDQVFLVVAGDEPLTGPERTAAARYWRLLRRARRDADAVAAAEADLRTAVGPDRAAAIRAHRPTGFAAGAAGATEDVNVAFLDLPKVPEGEIKPGSWTRAARARLLPDRFVVLGFVGGAEVFSVIGEACADSLVVSPDPSTPLEEQLRVEEDGSLRVPPEMAWLTDFDQAVRLGMGLRIKLDERSRNGLDRLLVLGLRLKTGPERGAADLEELLTHHHQSRTGLSLLPQGTPTNNTERAPARHEHEDEAETSFVDLFERPDHGVGPDDWGRKTDGQWLAELLGIEPRALRGVRHADATDQREARAMNLALWPATWGYFLQTMLQPIFTTEAVAATRDFFVSYVSGRGPAPTIRIGRQPYGILPTSAFSRFTVPRNDAHRTRLLQVINAAGADWANLAQQVAHVGIAGDPHALLLHIVGLHPASVEFHQRYGQSIEDYFNRLNLAGRGTDAIAALTGLGLVRSLRELLSRLGYDGRAPDPDLARRLFVGRQHALKGPLVDDRPLSETEPVRAYTTDGENYLRWLERSARRSLELIRLEEGFVGDTPPQALLYLLLRHALLLAWQDAGLRLAAEKRKPDQAALAALRRDPPFIHISRRAQRTESRFGQLYSTDPEITGEPDLLVGEYITRVIGQRPTIRDLAAQVDAIEVLADLPTARLERLLVEHLDCCSYRLDAWRLGLVNERLFEMRYGEHGQRARPGVHLGSYGWLEDVRPSTTTPTQVHLEGDLARTFSPPGSSPLLQNPDSGGYVHAPSLSQATTAALLRAGYVANASEANAETLAVNLTSERVRLALSVLEGIRGGQSLGALFGYRLERGLHDRYGLAEVDRFVFALREAFPLTAGRLPETQPPPGTPIEAVEARNVVDGLELVRHVTRTGAAQYPFGKAGLPPATAAQAAAINAEVARLLELEDALADLAVAEGVHQAVLGNMERAGSNLDAYAKGGFPPEPAVVETPRSGITITHRVGLHLRSGLSHSSSPVSMPVTPRASGEPAVNHWLADLLPDPDDVGCVVSWTDPREGTVHRHVVTQAQLGLQPIDLLWAARLDHEPAMTDLDDRIVGHVVAGQAPRPDAVLSIAYTEVIPGKVTFFQLSPLVAAVRALLVGARPLRASDLVRPAADDPVPADIDEAVEFPRARIEAVRDSLAQLADDLDRFADDLQATDASTLQSTVDALLSRFAELMAAAGRFGLSRSGWSELVAWRRAVYAEVLSSVAVAAERLTSTLAKADTAISAYDALPATATDEERFALLQQTERLLTTSPTSPRPADPAALRTIVGTRRSAFADRRNALAGIALTTHTTLAGLLADVQALLPIDELDPVGLDLTAFRDRVAAFCGDLGGRARGLHAEVTARLAAADEALASHDTTTPGTLKVEAATKALRGLLGPDALAVPEFRLSPEHATEWHNAYLDGESGRLTGHLTRDFPVDDWLHGVARVRERMRQWERIMLLGGAVGRAEPELVPLQLPHRPNDAWLGMELPPDQAIEGDYLLYTAYYATPFAVGRPVSAILLDEWTEVIPSPQETTGVAFHFDRPNAEPPQSMLLVTPPEAKGGWRFEDLVATLHDTLDLARTRGVEPTQLDATPYSQLLPATVMNASPQPITIATDLAANNQPGEFGG